MHLCVRPDGVGQVVHHDGRPRQQGHHTPPVRRAVRHDREAPERGAVLQGGGQLHGDLQREGARPPGPQGQQAVPEGEGAQRLGAVRGRPVPARRHRVSGHRQPHGGGKQVSDRGRHEHEQRVLAFARRLLRDRHPDIDGHAQWGVWREGIAHVARGPCRQ